MNDAAVVPLQTVQLHEPATPAPDSRRFTQAVLIALALHLAALAVGIYTPAPRQMGEETGSPEGLTVELVDPSEVPGAPPRPPTPSPAPSQPEQAQPTEPPSPPAQPATQAEQPAAQPSPTPPDLKPSAADDTPALEPAPPNPEPTPSPPQAAPSNPAATKPQSNKPVTIDTNDPNLFKIQPKPGTAPPSKPRASKPAPQPTKQPQLSMTMPPPTFSATEQGLGRSAGVSRPEGITRSGLNDEFGRGVIRALRQTMPPNDKKAQATVKFVLSPDGNLIEVQLVTSSGDAILDQNVVFAVKQSNFPIPATNLTALDRQFRVTYIYR